MAGKVAVLSEGWVREGIRKALEEIDTWPEWKKPNRSASSNSKAEKGATKETETNSDN